MGPHFVEYDAIKTFIGSSTDGGLRQASSEDTAKFVKLVKTEATRINGFAQQFLSDMRNSLVHYITKLLECKQALQSGGSSGEIEFIGQAWNDLSVTTVDFAQFCRLNSEAFRKIIKKFDKWGGRHVGDVLYDEFVSQPFATVRLWSL